jgi:hypothetical protein
LGGTPRPRPLTPALLVSAFRHRSAPRVPNDNRRDRKTIGLCAASPGDVGPISSPGSSTATPFFFSVSSASRSRAWHNCCHSCFARKEHDVELHERLQDHTSWSERSRECCGDGATPQSERASAPRRRLSRVVACVFLGHSSAGIRRRRIGGHEIFSKP